MAGFKDLLVKVGIDDRAFRKGTKRMSRSIKSLGSSLGVLGIGAGIALGLSDAFNKIKNFEQANADLASILGKANNEINKLSESAKNLGAVSAFSTSEITGLQTELAKLGFVEKDILKVTKSVGDFSIAVGTDAASAAEVAGGALRAFGLEANQMESLVSSLAIATTKSALNFEKLKTGLGIVAPVANAAGVSFERTTALLGVLANRGIEASMSATGLRNVFLELAKTGLTWEQAMEKINNSSNKNATALALFGKRGATVGTILAQTTDEANHLTQSITNQSAAMQIMVEQRLDTLEGKLILAKSAWEGFVLEIDSGHGIISNLVKDFTQDITNLLDELRVLNKFGFKGLSNRRKGIKNTDPSDFDRGRGSGKGRDSFGEQLDNTRKLVKNLEKGLLDLRPETEAFEQQQLDIAAATERLNKLLNQQTLLVGSTGNSGGASGGGISDINAGAALGSLGGGSSDRSQAGGGLGSSINIESLALATSAIDGMGWAGERTMKKINAFKEAGAIAGTAVGELSNEIMTASVNIGQALSTAFDGDNLGKGLLLALANLGEQIGKQLLVISIALKALQSLPIVGKIAAAIALIGASKLLRGVAEGGAKKLASGGLAYGPLNAIVGDNPGARHDPEVIAPLSKLKGMLSSGGGAMSLVARVAGSDLEFILERQSVISGRSR